MSLNSMVQKICCCMEVLFEVKSRDPDEAVKKPTNEKEAVLSEFQKNINLAFEKIESYSELKSLTASYLKPCLENRSENCIVLNYFQLCVVLLKLLCEALLREEKESKSKDSKPKGLLSISQQVIVKKCLQFVVALGVIPHLLPRVGIPQNKRMEYPEVLNNVLVNSTPAQKHSILVISMKIFLSCLKCDALQGFVLSYHGSDLLAALFQLCYAPVKKTEETKADSDGQMQAQKIDSEECDIVQKITLLTDESSYDEKQLLHEMIENQKYFKPKLEELMKQMSPSILMFNLLMFHGISRNTNRILGPPAWFQKQCNICMTKLLLGKHGIIKLVEAVLNHTLNGDGEEVTTQLLERLNGLARVIVFNPVEELSTDQLAESLPPKKSLINETYMKKMSKQVLDMLYFKGDTLYQRIINFVASSIILTVTEHNDTLAKECFWDIILKPLQLCVGGNTSDSDLIVGEQEMTLCVENLYTIFVSGDLSAAQQHIKILWPFFHVLFDLYCFLENSILFLKTHVQNILCKILAYADDEQALFFLRTASLGRSTCQEVLRSSVSFVLAEEGGVKALPKVHEDLFLIQIRCHSIFTLLSEVKNKPLNSSFLIFILKEYCTYNKNMKEGKHEMYDEHYGITLAFLAQEIPSWEDDLGEAFLSNVPEVIDSLMFLLENSCIDSPKDESFDDDIMTVLIFMSSLLMIDDKLTPSDWTALQKCVPSLQKLYNSDLEPYMKAVVFNILAFVATHGAGASSDLYAEFEKEYLSSKDDFESLQEDCENTSTKTVEETETPQKIEPYVPQVKETSSSKEIEPYVPQVKETNSSKEIESNVPHVADTSSSKEKELYVPQKVVRNDSQSSVSSEVTSSKVSDCENLSSKFSQSCRIKSNINSTKKKSRSSKTKLQKISQFEAAINDIRDSSIPSRGHGLIALGKLISMRDAETTAHREEILKILQENIEDEDSYIYLSAIQALSFLAEIDTELVLPVALNLYLNPDGKKCEFILKVGEVLLKICRSLGDLAFKYRDQLLHAYLVGAKNEDPNIRSSSLSNLGEACLHLKFNIAGHWLQEILVCVKSLLTTDKDLEVRRCAVMVIYLLLRGTGKDTLEVLENDIKSIYAQLKIIYCTADDDVLRLHSQMALEEINTIMRHLLTKKIPLLKQIRIL